MILAGDIGGTSTRVAIVDASASVPRILAEERHASGSFDSVASLAQSFVSSHAGRVRAACFGVAGPVTGRQVRLTNLPWLIDADEIEAAIDAPVSLLNDLVAHAYGLPALEADERQPLNAGSVRAAGNRAVVAAGTGLGEAGLFWDGQAHHPFPTEGGHADFAPPTPVGRALLEYLATRHPRVSVEHVVSGPGITAIFEFLRDSERMPEPAALAARLAESSDRSAVISDAALRGESEICVRTIDLFLEYYGAEAGNFALKVLATGGVFIGGGIAPKIAPCFARSSFIRAFVAKDRMEALLADIPVWLVTSDRTGLLGAARYAAGARSA